MVLWAFIVARWYQGPKPRDAQSVASSQQGELFRAWLGSSRLSRLFHVRPGANGDGPWYVAGMAPKGHLGAPALSAMWGGSGPTPVTCQGKPQVTGGGRTPSPSYDAMPADAHSLGTWHPARGEFNLPRVGTVPGAPRARILPRPPPSPPDTHACRLAASQGLHRFRGLHSLGSGQPGSCCLAFRKTLIGKSAQASFLAQPLSFRATGHPAMGGPGRPSPCRG